MTNKKLSEKHKNRTLHSIIKYSFCFVAVFYFYNLYFKFTEDFDINIVSYNPEKYYSIRDTEEFTRLVCQNYSFTTCSCMHEKIRAKLPHIDVIYFIYKNDYYSVFFLNSPHYWNVKRMLNKIGYDYNRLKAAEKELLEIYNICERLQ